MSVTARTQRTSTAQSGRFGRSGAGRSATSRPTGRRSSTPQRRAGTRGVIRRRPPQQSSMQKAFGAFSGLGGRTSSRSSSRGKGGKAGGVALLTAAAGFAFQNRDKLTAMLRRNRSEQPSPQPSAEPSVPPTPTGAPTVQP